MEAVANADRKWSEEKMEAQDGMRTVECLRGRLLAERASSRAAKEAAEKIGNKLIELENKLKEERRSRDRVDKKLKFLLKKLEAINITFVSDESDPSSLTEKCEVSSVSSNSTKEPEEEEQFMKNNVIQQNTSNLSSDSSPIDLCLVPHLTESEIEESIVALQCHNESSPKVTTDCDLIQYSQCHVDLKRNEHEYISKSSVEHEEIAGKNGEDGKENEEEEEEEEGIAGRNGEDGKEEDDADNRWALVQVQVQKREEKTDTVALDATVRDVLAALSYAKEKLQSSMERRPMIRVGSR